VIKEEIGLHIDQKIGFEKLGKAISRNLKEIMSLNMNDLLKKRYEKYRQIGFG
jgi:acetyl-CoA carboxylase alpha subunit